MALFGGKTTNPADKANDYLDKIPEAMRPYFDKYINQGNDAGDKLTGQYDDMTTNTGEFYNNLGKGYKESPGFKYKLQQALAAGQNASASGGMLGTPQDQQQQMGIANGIASQDFEEYMKHMMDIFGQGQKGQQEIQKQGFGASTQFGEDVGDVLGRQAQNAFEGQAGINKEKSNNWSNLFKAGGALAGGALGWMGGGPSGAVTGAGVGSKLFG